MLVRIVLSNSRSVLGNSNKGIFAEERDYFRIFWL
jgi:hypothetical protein